MSYKQQPLLITSMKIRIGVKMLCVKCQKHQRWQTIEHEMSVNIVSGSLVSNKTSILDIIKFCVKLA